MEPQIATMPNDLREPEVLSPDGRACWYRLTTWLKEHDMTFTGGCRAFYSPNEWRARGERYGTDSELVICHDGGNLSELFNPYGREASELYSRVQKEVFEPLGLWFEACTCWYTAVYKKR